MPMVSITPAPWDRPPQDQTLARIAGKAFEGNISLPDLKYMAFALLQMSDDMAALRRRVELLERRQGSSGRHG